MESEIIRIWRTRLPHWEVRNARYFVTIRCLGSLPVEVVGRLSEIHDSLQTHEPASAMFSKLQRQYFLTMERYLDQGSGFSPFAKKNMQELGVNQFLDSFEKDGWVCDELVLMPNHCHMVAWSVGEEAVDLSTCMKRLKGRLSRFMNQALGRKGRFWQRDWFDRWIRTEAEYERTVRYIRDNSVKAGLATCAEEYAGYWQRSL